MAGGLDTLCATIADELRQAYPAAVGAMVAEIRRRHPRGIAAILFYGSCLRRGEPIEGVLDLYVLVDDYQRFYGRALPALANAILPPNVFYAELVWEGRTFAAKYAVISLRQFARGTSRRSLPSSLWARFAQPARLAFARDDDAAAAAAAALAEAVVAMVGASAALVGERFTPAELWQAGFAATYGAELRSEGAARAVELYAAERTRYDRLTPPALAAFAMPATADASGAALSGQARRRERWRWRLRRPLGKLLNLLRLVKGAFTFSGAVDYVLWKVERHSGVRIAASPWQRRHPLLAAPVLAWRLYRRGGFR